MRLSIAGLIFLLWLRRSNNRRVVPRFASRSSQPTAEGFRDLRATGVETVVSLKGMMTCRTCKEQNEATSEFSHVLGTPRKLSWFVPKDPRRPGELAGFCPLRRRVPCRAVVRTWSDGDAIHE